MEQQIILLSVSDCRDCRYVDWQPPLMRKAITQICAQDQRQRQMVVNAWATPFTAFLFLALGFLNCLALVHPLFSEQKTINDDTKALHAVLSPAFVMHSTICHSGLSHHLSGIFSASCTKAQSVCQLYVPLLSFAFSTTGCRNIFAFHRTFSLYSYKLDGQGKARREAARRRNSECKINLSCRNYSRGNGSRPTAHR